MTTTNYVDPRGIINNQNPMLPGDPPEWILEANKCFNELLARFNERQQNEFVQHILMQIQAHRKEELDAMYSRCKIIEESLKFLNQCTT